MLFQEARYNNEVPLGAALWVGRAMLALSSCSADGATAYALWSDLVLETWRAWISLNRS